MERIRKFLKELWAEKHGLLQVLAYILVVGWFVFALGIIVGSSILLLPKIIVVAGILVLGFFACIGIHEGFSVDDE